MFLFLDMRIILIVLLLVIRKKEKLHGIDYNCEKWLGYQNYWQKVLPRMARSRIYYENGKIVEFSAIYWLLEGLLELFCCTHLKKYQMNFSLPAAFKTLWNKKNLKIALLFVDQLVWWQIIGMVYGTLYWYEIKSVLINRDVEENFGFLLLLVSDLFSIFSVCTSRYCMRKRYF